MMAIRSPFLLIVNLIPGMFAGHASLPFVVYILEDSNGQVLGLLRLSNGSFKLYIIL